MVQSSRGTIALQVDDCHCIRFCTLLLAQLLPGQAGHAKDALPQLAEYTVYPPVEVTLFRVSLFRPLAWI